ncbi:hypothetical protein TWF694_004640 [Orbilia ellipsospora]|uniref:tyrosinase n=1 Tax=Orbilia ellipsospora TaxID=2528407 RepID=A0AAV9WVQ3_9PEZI
MSGTPEHPHGQSPPYDHISTKTKNNPKIFKWIVKGIEVAPGEEVPVRRDINELVASEKEIDQDQVNLFLLGLKQFQERAENDPKSYFMMAGIHGLPERTTWDGETYQTGRFCAHTSILFPTWHRLYLSLFEKYLWDIINEIAGNYEDTNLKERYQKAAKIWRLPYWDPAKITDHKVYNGVSIPSLVTWPFRDVQDIDGKWKSIINPTYSYVYHTGDDKRINEMVTTEVDYSKLKTTARQPYATHIGTLSMWRDAPVDATKTEEWRAMQMYLNDRQPHQNQNNYHITEIFREDISFRQSVYDALIFNKKYTRMASTGFNKRQDDGGRARTEVSIEGIHNTIHNYTGGVGQMGDVPVAAFDPIFWFHHANIDRWCAIWEKLNPDAWWSKDDAKEQEDTADPDDDVHGPDDQGPGSKLYPFYETNAQAWTPDRMKESKLDFGYTYEDLSVSPEELKRNVGILYNGLAKDLRREPIKAALKDIYQEEAPEGQILFYDYCARVKYDKFALGGQAYTIHLFIGDFDSKDSKSWATAKAHLGSIFNFASPSPVNKPGGCENCKAKEKAGQIVVGSVSMTQAVIQGMQDPKLKKGVNDILKGEGVKAFFDKNFTSKLTTRDGKEVINVEKIMPAFEVEIFRRKGTIKAAKDNYDPPEYLDFESIWKKTAADCTPSCDCKV